MNTPSVLRFPCTPGGAIARGSRRLSRFLAVLAWILVTVAAAALAYGRIGGAILALLAVAGPLVARGLLRGAAPATVELAPGVLTVVTASVRVNVALDGVQARRLAPEEIAHLEALATVGGVTAGTGSFDSHLLGELDLHATNLRNAVFLALPERSVVVTPDDPEALLSALGQPQPPRHQAGS